jgi:hypothetical protein
MKKTFATILTLAGLLTPTLFAHADITSNLISLYKFDEGGGSTAIDSGSLGNNGTEINIPTYVTGKIGPYALSFNGSTQYITTSNAANYNFSSADFTVSAWIKTTDTEGTILTTIVPSSYSGWEFALSAGTGSPFNVPCIWNTVEWYCGTTSANDGNWHLVTATYINSTQTLKIYVDGSITNTFTSVAAPGYVGTPLWVGNRNDSTGGLYWDGNLDDVRIYNRALSSGDVSQLYAYTGIPFTISNIFQAAEGEIIRIAKGSVFTIY